MPCALVVEERPGQVGRQQVGGELRAREVAARAPARTSARPASCRGRGSPRAARGPSPGSRGQHQHQRLALADDGLLDLVEHPAGEAGGLGRRWGSVVMGSQLLDPFVRRLDLAAGQPAWRSGEDGRRPRARAGPSARGSSQPEAVPLAQQRWSASSPAGRAARGRSSRRSRWPLEHPGVHAEPGVLTRPGDSAGTRARPRSGSVPGDVDVDQRQHGHAPAPPAAAAGPGRGCVSRHDEQHPDGDVHDRGRAASQPHQNRGRSSATPPVARPVDHVERLQRLGPVGLGDLVVGEPSLAVELGQPRSPRRCRRRPGRAPASVNSEEVSQGRPPDTRPRRLLLEAVPARDDRVARAALGQQRRAAPRRPRPAPRATRRGRLERLERDARRGFGLAGGAASSRRVEQPAQQRQDDGQHHRRRPAPRRRS